MIFKRIDDATINCIITSEDLDERGLSIEDLFRKREEATLFLREIIDQAGKEVDYHPTGSYVTMQIAILPDQSVSLTLSENREVSIAGALRSLADKLQQFVDQLHARQQEAQEAQREAAPVREVFVYAFDSVRHAARFASTAPVITGESSLYKNEKDGGVQLVMVYENTGGVVLELNGETVDAQHKSFYRLIAHAGEYGRFVTADPRAVMVLCENNPCLIREHALERLSVL